MHKTEWASDCLDVSHHVSGTNSRMWFRQQCISLDVIRRRSHPISRCWMCHCTYTRAPVLEVCRSFRKKARDVLDCGKSCQPITGADLELDPVFVLVCRCLSPYSCHPLVWTLCNFVCTARRYRCMIRPFSPSELTDTRRSLSCTATSKTQPGSKDLPVQLHRQPWA